MIMLCLLVFASAGLADPMPARDMLYITPNEDSEVLCDHAFCFG